MQLQGLSWAALQAALCWQPVAVALLPMQHHHCRRHAPQCLPTISDDSRHHSHQQTNAPTKDHCWALVTCTQNSTTWFEVLHPGFCCCCCIRFFWVVSPPRMPHYRVSGCSPAPTYSPRPSAQGNTRQLTTDNHAASPITHAMHMTLYTGPHCPSSQQPPCTASNKMHQVICSRWLHWLRTTLASACCHTHQNQAALYNSCIHAPTTALLHTVCSVINTILN